MRKLIVLLAAVMAGWILPTPAQAVVVAAGPGASSTTYATPVAVAPVGGPLQFVNSDIAPHNVVALEDFLPQKKAKKADWCDNYKVVKKKKNGKKKVRYRRCPVFWSETVGAGGVTEVLGLEHLQSGEQYVFYCTIHPRMQGTLVVV